ncbi:MAG: FkbM family methyltransferase [Terriglobia bacterium]
MLTVLRRFGIYERLRATWVYDLYWWVRDPARTVNRREEIEFYRNLLVGFCPGDLIFDVGANVGMKTGIFLRLGARIVAVEPDKNNQEVIREKFLKYRLTPKPVTIVGKALSDRNGVESMWIDGPGSALNTFSKKWVETLRLDKARFAHTMDKLEFAGQAEVETTTLEHVIAAYGVPFYIKIDVEGHEPSVLRGLQHPVPYLSFEVNLPEFRPEGLECVDLLGRLDAGGAFNYTSDTERGLAEKRWLDRGEFSQFLDHSPDKTIEVFWKSSESKGR